MPRQLAAQQVRALQARLATAFATALAASAPHLQAGSLQLPRSSKGHQGQLRESGTASGTARGTAVGRSLPVPAGLGPARGSGLAPAPASAAAATAQLAGGQGSRAGARREASSAPGATKRWQLPQASAAGRAARQASSSASKLLRAASCRSIGRGARSLAAAAAAAASISSRFCRCSWRASANSSA
jgi:hypothetical protein